MRLATCAAAWTPASVRPAANSVMIRNKSVNGSGTTALVINGGFDPVLTSWTRYCLNIPAAAFTTSTRFRWFQNASSGVGFDTWGLDDMVITLNTPGFTYDWAHDAQAPNASPSTPPVTPSATTTYTVTATDANSCTATDAVIVAINPGATVTAGIDKTACSLSAITLGGAIGGSATIGTWSGTYAGTFSSLTNPTGTYTPNASEAGSTITLTLTTNDPDGAGPCTAVSDNMNISISNLVANAGSDVAFCGSGTVVCDVSRVNPKPYFLQIVSKSSRSVALS